MATKTPRWVVTQSKPTAKTQSKPAAKPKAIATGATVATLAQSMDMLTMLVNHGIDTLRVNGPLVDDEWITVDRGVTAAFSEPLVGIVDLRDRNLTADLGDMGTIVSRYALQSEMNEAEISMWAEMDAEQATTDLDVVDVPVPCIFKEWQLPARLLMASRRQGEGLDIRNGRAAARVVGEKLEELLFNGGTSVYGALPIYGYRTHPNRNTGTGSDWGTASNVFVDIAAMVNKLRDDHIPGPYVLYLHSDQFKQTEVFVDTTRNLTEKAVALATFAELEAIKFTSQVPTGEAVMVAMNPDVVDLGVAEDLATIPWSSRGDLVHHFRVMIVAVPRVKADYSGRSGIAHYTGI